MLYACYSWRNSFLRNLKFMSLLWVIQMWSVHHALQASLHLSRQFHEILLCWIWLITWLNSHLLKIGWRRIEKPKAALSVEYLDRCIWLGFLFLKLNSYWQLILWILLLNIVNFEMSCTNFGRSKHFEVETWLKFWGKHLNLKFSLHFFFEKCKHKISELPSYIQHSLFVRVQYFRRQVFWNCMWNCWWGDSTRSIKVPFN